MNIGIIGTGGVGGYFGGKLAKCFEGDKDNKVFFLARGEHLKKINENGLTLLLDGKETVNCRPFLASDDINDFETLDICIICVKAYDLNNVIKQIKNKITKETEIIPLLNGIDIPDRIKKVAKDVKVYPSCVYIGTHIKEPGVIETGGGEAKIFTGYHKEDKSKKLPKYLEVFKKAGIDYEWTEENYKAIWEKYMCVAPYSIVCAYNDKTMGEVYNDKLLFEKTLKIAEFILNAAEKEGIILSKELPLESINKAKDYPMDLKTSFHRDFECKDKPNEKEIFVDTLLSLGKKHNLNSACIKNIIY